MRKNDFVEVLTTPYNGEIGQIKDTVLYIKGYKASLNAFVSVKIFVAPEGLPELFYYHKRELKRIPKHEAIVRLL